MVTKKMAGIDVASSIPKKITKADREAIFMARREKVLSALRKACRLCEPNEYKSIHNVGHLNCSTFLGRVYASLGFMVTNPKISDISILQFLPNGSMQRAFKEMKVQKMSEFIAVPLEDMLDVAGMKLPLYIHYMHPEFDPPTKKECQRLHKARK